VNYWICHIPSSDRGKAERIFLLILLQMKTYFRILGYGSPFFYLLFLALFFLFLYNLFSAISLTMVIPFLEILFSSQPMPEPEVPLSILDVASLKAHFYYWLSKQMAIHGKLNVLYGFCLVVFIAIVLKNLFRYLSSYCIAPFEQGIIRNLRDRIFEKLTRLSLHYFTYQRKGQLMNLILNDVQIVQEAVVGTLMPLLSDPITMVIYLLTMLIISWKLTLFTLLVLPLTALVISRIARSLRKRADKAQTLLDLLMAFVDELIGGIRIVKAFNGEPYEVQKYRHHNHLYTRVMVNFRRRSELASPLTEILSILVVLVILIYGSTLILQGENDLKSSEFIGFIALFSQFLAPIKTFSGAISRIQKAIVSYNRIENLLNQEPDPTLMRGKREVNGFEESIQLCNVHFGYEDREVLKGITFTIRKGMMVALVGPSGAGKSTLVDLICRFYDPQEGVILFDRIPYPEINVHSLRRLMGIVSQEGFLFNDTVKNNITYGSDSYTMEEIIQAAKAANAHEFIMELPQGYDTVIGERGLRLSGGQRQRIAIARAILKNPPILILDEATSALDTLSEQLVQQALNHLMENRTAIVIAHRLSTIQRADLILVLDQGRIVEQGRHEELLQRNGLYRKLYELQFEKQSTVS